MSRRIVLSVLLLLTLVGVSFGARDRSPRVERVRLRQVADGFTSPLALVEPPDQSGRRFIVDQTGVIRILTASGSLLPQPFLDVRSRMVQLRSGYEERGLLGLAFHPDYAQNGRFFVYYSAPLRAGAPANWDHTNRLAEYRVSSDPNVAAAASERVILDVDHPHGHFNGGTVTFGPDRFLYLSIGDPSRPRPGNAQEVNNLLGKILRLDVDGGDPYAVPSDNPFVGREGRDEIYAYGLRNPYRFSFDMAGSRMMVAGDAGQSRWEEHDVIVRGGNYGWNIREGRHCYDPENEFASPRNCPKTGSLGEPLINPVIEYPNAKSRRGGLGYVTIGGYIYRGALYPQLRGQYVFGDWSRDASVPSGQLFVAAPRARGSWKFRQLKVSGGPGGRLRHYVLGLAQDAAGEMYVLTTDRIGPSGTTGRVLQIVRPGRR